MGCLYSNFEGKCDFYPDEVKLGCDWKGFCVVEEDPTPEDSCDSYEWDGEECPECGEKNEGGYSVCEFCDYCWHCALSECECEWE